MGIKPREFVEMDMFEKAVVIAYLEKYAESKKKEHNAIKKGRKRK